VFGPDADAILARYPWPADADEFTALYLFAAVITDAGAIAGIGGCPTLDLIHAFARHTRTYAYEFANRTGPGLVPVHGYVWGAGHAIELAYLFPSFNNGPSITAQFDAGDRRLAIEMKRYWGAFVRNGSPQVNAQQRWPAYDITGAILSLRPGSRSALIRDSIFRKEHQCSFWDSLGYSGS
jgi:para-nitrobenzyl esterase